MRKILPLDSAEKTVRIMVGAAQALVQLSRMHIIHRDIKPDNFLLKNEVVKLGDFGLAEMGEKASGTYGTPGYVLSEVFISDRMKTSVICGAWEQWFTNC